MELGDLNLRSPLAKRKKLADQRGSSSLRQEVDIPDSQDESTPGLSSPAMAGSEGYASELRITPVRSHPKMTF